MKKITACIFILGIVIYGTVSGQTPVKKVLLEEYTTASCGACPPQSALINSWHNVNASSTVLVTIHQGSGVDAMSSATTTAIFDAMHPAASWFAPAIMIDRGVYPSTNGEVYLSVYKSFGGGAGPGVDSIATRLMNETAKVGVNISGTYNSATRTINATVSVKFVETVPSGDWRINLFLVEDSVIGYPGFGCFDGWDQKCYDPTWANTNYPGKFDGTYIIGYPHRHVMRDALLGDWGKQGIIPSVPVIGTNYSTSTNLVFDTAYKTNHLSLVAFVSSFGSNKTDKFVLNANEVKMEPTFTTGINVNLPAEKNYLNSIDQIYPLPSNGITYISYTLARDCKSEITISNMFGQQVDVLYSSNEKAGQYQLAFDASKFSKGIYYISLNTTSGTQVKKFIIQ